MLYELWSNSDTPTRHLPFCVGDRLRIYLRISEDVKTLADICPDLCAETVSVNVMNGLNLNILTVCDALGKRVSKSGMVVDFGTGPDENRRRRPNTLFPVQILPYLYLGNDETAKNIETLKR